MQIQRYGRKDVIFHGDPSEIYYSSQLTDRVPRFSFLSPSVPEALILFSKYVAIFSSGMAVINVIPCFYFDGQHIASLLTNSLLKKKIKQHSIRAIISSIITAAFTLLLIINLFKMYLNKIY